MSYRDPGACAGSAHAGTSYPTAARGRVVSERGSGTVLGIALILVVSTLAMALILVASVLTVRARLTATADLAALAGANAQVGLVAGAPCDRAGEVAGRAELALAECVVVDDDVVVRIAGTAMGIPLTARARAGPVEPVETGAMFVNPVSVVYEGWDDARGSRPDRDATGEPRGPRSDTS